LGGLCRLTISPTHSYTWKNPVLSTVVVGEYNIQYPAARISTWGQLVNSIYNTIGLRQNSGGCILMSDGQTVLNNGRWCFDYTEIDSTVTYDYGFVLD